MYVDGILGDAAESLFTLSTLRKPVGMSYRLEKKNGCVQQRLYPIQRVPGRCKQSAHRSERQRHPVGTSNGGRFCAARRYYSIDVIKADTIRTIRSGKLQVWASPR